MRYIHLDECFGGGAMITLQQLTYFRELAENGHLTRTAEKLYITQATLSNVISNLEKQLGVKLFERVGRGLQLSRAGELYYESVAQALNALETGRTRIDGLLREREEKVSFATNNSIVWAELIRDFQKKCAGYSVRQVNCIDPEQTREMLMNMQMDFAIAGVTDFAMAGLEYRVFREERVGVCLPMDHPLAGRERIALKELSGEKFINLPGEHPFQRYCDKLLQEAGVKVEVVMESDYRMSTPLIESGVGIALTTYSSYRQSASFLGGRTVCVPLEDGVEPRPIALVWNPHRQLNHAARAFRDFIPEWEKNRKG